MHIHAPINWKQLLEQIQGGLQKAISRGISMVENEVPGFENLLQSLPYTDSVTIIGITGPPGAGKSTLSDSLIGEMVQAQKKVAVLCVDPSSPFNMGALLGDRIRMSRWHSHPSVFIRSLASRGSLGGVHPKIFEITEVLKASTFDYILIETVGVGQSEVEIAGLADVTVVVLVPESGDDIQIMKAGLLEIANIFVVNKCDRPGADLFVKNLQSLSPFQPFAIPILKTNAVEKQGISQLMQTILKYQEQPHQTEKKFRILAQRVRYMIQEKRMQDICIEKLVEEIKILYNEKRFNLYQLAEKYT